MDIINAVKQKHNLQAVSCGRCNLSTLQPDHVRNRNRQCPLGQNNCNCLHPGGKITCPNNVCGAIYDEIIKTHASTPPTPCWKNTNVKDWCTDPWAVAKCFINAPGYAMNAKAEEIDCTGLLHLYINSKYLQRKIQCQITGQDVFTKTRSARNSISHSNNMEMEDVEVNEHIDNMIAVLEDGKELINRQESQVAVSKLKELKTSSFVMSTQDEAIVIKDAFDEIDKKVSQLKETVAKGEESITNKEKETVQSLQVIRQQLELKARELLDNIKKDGCDIKKDLEIALRNALDQLKTQMNNITTSAKETISKYQDEACIEIEQTKTAAIETMGVSSENMKQSAEGAILKHKEEACSEMERTKSTAIEMMQTSSEGIRTSTEKEILKHKYESCVEIEQTKTAAIETMAASVETFSSKVYSSESALSDRIDNIEEKLKTNEETSRMKDMPSLEQGASAYTQSKKDFKKALVKMYLENAVRVSPVLLQPDRTDTVISELYVDPLLRRIETNVNGETEEDKRISSYKEVFETDGKEHKLIYLIGEAGTGKSTFCINMVHRWCLAHSDEEADKESEDVRFMKKFDFLFYIMLRHNTDTADISTMVRNNYGDHIIDSFMEKETDNCLILLDGLDEWNSAAEQKTVSQFQSKGLPKRNHHKAYTIITTSRPWKFESLGIKSTEIDQKLRLLGVYDVKKMAGKIIDELNEIVPTNKDRNDFYVDFSSCPFENDMKHVPMVLQQLVCLWFDGKLNNLGKCEIYCNMASLFFEWAETRNPDNQVLKIMKGKSFGVSDVTLPDKCIRTELCEEYKYVIFHVGKLAYKTLFSEEKEFSLSFSDSLFKKLEIPEKVIDCCLNTGILSKTREVGLSISRRKRVTFSFIHKTLQEFFAAIFIFIEIRRNSPNMFKICNMETIDDDIKCIHEFLGKCKTVNHVLEQSNVIILLCGFDLSLAVHVSKFLYNIAHKDESFIDFRRNIKCNLFLTDDIITTYLNFGRSKGKQLRMQNLIFSIIKETLIPEGKAERLFFLADIFSSESSYDNSEILRYVKTEYVLSFYMDLFTDCLGEHLSDFLNDPNIGRNISTLKIVYYTEMAQCEANVLLKSITTIECLHFAYQNMPLEHRDKLLEGLPRLRNLLSFKIERLKLSHKEKIDLCRFLSKATYLRQISLLLMENTFQPNIHYEAYPLFASHFAHNKQWTACQLSM